jgi:hypothetical protein
MKFEEAEDKALDLVDKWMAQMGTDVDDLPQPNAETTMLAFARLIEGIVAMCRVKFPAPAHEAGIKDLFTMAIDKGLAIGAEIRRRPRSRSY